MLACSSEVEQLAVNQKVVGSIPTLPANIKEIIMISQFGINLPDAIYDLWKIKGASKNVKHNHPGLCDLCGVAIDVEDLYYIGATHIGEKQIIYAFTCTDFKCTKWLKEKKLYIKDK